VRSTVTRVWHAARRRPVDAAMATAWMRCMRRAFDDCHVTGDVRDYLDARLGEVATFMRNQPG